LLMFVFLPAQRLTYIFIVELLHDFLLSLPIRQQKLQNITRILKKN